MDPKDLFRNPCSADNGPLSVCGLLGRKLPHSFSPQIHRMLGNYPYTLFEKEPEELEDFLKNGNFTGINVTMPYKKAVIPYLDELSPAAKKIGAVNTIIRRSDGTLYGHNTDYFGFQAMVEHCGLSFSGKKVLVLGSGGASNTVAAVLRDMDAHVTVISRSGENTYDTLVHHADASVIVNATPVGMYPNNGLTPVHLDLFPKLEGVLDLIYNPCKTRLLLDGEQRGIVTENGLWMLIAQAKEALEYFTGTKISDSIIPRIYSRLSAQTKNLVLIGMPGCGKSTIGKLLADRLGKTFADSDEAIVALAQKSIPDIFAQDGESAFRDMETKVISDLGKQSGMIIATGGGCITRKENYDLLHQNGTIIWLKRPLDLLPSDGRPLSQTNQLSDLYAIREPLYAAFSDFAVDNTGAAEDTVEKILSILEEQT